MIRELVERLIDAIIARAMKTPYFHLPEYMNRYWLVKPSRWTFGCGIRVHQILRSDSDRHLHDHPWGFATVILRGGYLEVLEQRIVHRSELSSARLLSEWACVHFRSIGAHRFLLSYGRDCPPGSVVIHRPTARHRLVLQPGHHAWTLFFMGPAVQEWGFYTETGKVHWKDYLPPGEAEWQRTERAKHGVGE